MLICKKTSSLIKSNLANYSSNQDQSHTLWYPTSTYIPCDYNEFSKAKHGLNDKVSNLEVWMQVGSSTQPSLERGYKPIVLTTGQ